MSHTPKPKCPQLSLADQLKTAREKLGLSQSEAAKEWGVNVRTLQDWELGRSSPRGFARAQLDKLLTGINGTSARPKRPSPC